MQGYSGAGGDAGALTLVDSYEVTGSAIQTYDIPGVSMAEGERLEISVDIVNGYAGTESYSAYVQADYTDANYYRGGYYHYHNTGTMNIITAANDIKLLSCLQSGLASGFVRISIAGERVCLVGEYLRGIESADPADRTTFYCDGCKPGASISTITAVRIAAAHAGGLGVGTIITTYLRAKS